MNKIKNNLSYLEQRWVEPIISPHYANIEKIESFKLKQYNSDSCAIISKTSPYHILFNRKNIIKKYLNRKKQNNSLKLAKNYKEFIQLIFAHEIGHIIHQKIEKNINEIEIINFLLQQDIYSTYKRDGWRDIFAEIYALRTVKPELFTPDNQQEFFDFVNKNQ